MDSSAKPGSQSKQFWMACEAFGDVWKGFWNGKGVFGPCRNTHDHENMPCDHDFVIGQFHRADLPSQYRLGTNLEFAKTVLWQATLFSVLQGKVQVYIDIYKGLWFLQFFGMSFWRQKNSFLVLENSGKEWSSERESPE